MVNMSGLNSSISTGACRPQISMCKGDSYCRERTLNLLAGKVQSRQSQEQEAACARQAAGGVAGPLLLPLPALPLQAHTDMPRNAPPCPPLPSPEWEQHREQDAAEQQGCVWIPQPRPEGTLSTAKGRVQLTSLFNHGQLFFFPVKSLLADKLHIRQLRTGLLLNCSHSHQFLHDAQVWDSVLGS